MPHYLSLNLVNELADVADGIITPNTEKIEIFLQSRIDALIDLVEAKGYLKNQKKFDFVGTQPKGEKKVIPNEIIDILKKDIPDAYLNDLINNKYAQVKNIKPVNLDMYVEEV